MKHVLLLSLNLDPRFGTNRGFVPVSLPSNAHSVNEIEHNLRAMSFGTATENSKSDDINGEKKESPNATLPASLGGFPMLKPCDLDPSLAKPKTVSLLLRKLLFLLLLNCPRSSVIFFLAN